MSIGYLKCEEYSVEAIRAILDKINIPDVSNKNVLLKPNMLSAFPAHLCVTTHPDFVSAVIQLCYDKGASEVWVGDSHNGLFPTNIVWEKTGMSKVCEKTGAKPKRFEDSVVERNGLLLTKYYFDADIVINLPKLKTHGLTLITCAVKNMFGCIPGMKKAGMHREHFNREEFDEFLVKLSQVVKPHFNIVDAIVGMDGSGPSAGKPKKMNLVLFGEDTFQVDELACRLIGVNPMDVGTQKKAHDLNLWKPSSENVDCLIDDFAIPASYSKNTDDSWLARLILKLIWNNASVKPVIDEKLCKRCYRCLKICPVNAIKKDENGFLDIDYDLCGECFCCHEVCSDGVIELKPTLAVRVVQWFLNRKSKKNSSQS